VYEIKEREEDKSCELRIGLMTMPIISLNKGATLKCYFLQQQKKNKNKNKKQE
jgi:hypothetical protein